MTIASATSPVTRIDMPLTAGLLGKPKGTEKASDVDFASLIGESVGEVNSLQQQSTQSMHEMLTGGDVQPAEVFASVQKADMAFRMLLQVRNKLMQAYEEVNAIRI